VGDGVPRPFNLAPAPEDLYETIDGRELSSCRKAVDLFLGLILQIIQAPNSVHVLLKNPPKLPMIELATSKFNLVKKPKNR